MESPEDEDEASCLEKMFKQATELGLRSKD